MSVNLFLLKSGEFVISEGKELISDDRPCGYLFENPYKVLMNSPMFLTEETDSSVQVSLSPWIVLSANNKIPIPRDWVVTVVDPIESIKKMYEEQVNGESN